MLVAACASTGVPAGEGRFVERGPFTVEGLPDQRLTIWLPPGYDDGARRYPVLYMHDGHNLFDPAVSNFNKVWAADKAMLEAAASGVAEPHIIVGMWPPGEDRYRQYLPAFAPEKAEGEVAEAIAELAGGPVVSQRYLEWIADELKPQIDAEFRTLTGPADTAIAGSSMGGIMSCWAIVERPDLFGRAACVSSHWPLIMPEAADARRTEVLGIWSEYLAKNLGTPAGRRIWMDHGTATLDAFYPPYQAAIDEDFRAEGWVEGEDFRSEQYDGAEHEENAWAARLPEIFTWLLAEE
ncbi:hypothetical protein D6201_01015 [Aurantiacibacter aquimixticola]|uniref:Alpha/beta hydrolase n=1 Tax=Aurantiacibacter aquimixticola TaxID=1958945 RepID=A0A419RWD0_9SPHN|nr:hypothetical protein D6201_01015 [Aurantiacibacter aquimixticola]